MSTNQRGSIESIIIVVLVVALIGALGYIAYKNLGSADPKERKVSSKETAKLVKHCAEAEKLCFDYPSDWKLDARQAENDNDGSTLAAKGGDIIVLTSPDGGVTLNLTSKVTGMGGACGGPEGPVSVVYSTAVGAVTNPAESDYFVDTAHAVGVVYSVVDGDNGDIQGYQPEVVLSAAKDFSSVHTYSVCSGRPMGNFLPGRAVITDSEGQSYKGELSFVSKDPSQKVYKTLDEAKAVLETPNYQAMNKILLSAHYE